AGADRLVFDIGRVGIGSAEYRAAPNARAGEQHSITEGPVISAGVGVDLRSAAHVAHHDYQSVLEQAADLEVLHEGAVGGIQGRQGPTQPAEVVGVGVP